MGIWCQNDVVSTLMRHNDVASTLIWRHFYVMCPLGKLPLHFALCGVKMIERLGDDADGRGFEPRVESAGDWKLLAISNKWVPFSKQERIRHRKERKGLHLSYTGRNN